MTVLCDETEKNEFHTKSEINLSKNKDEIKDEIKNNDEIKNDNENDNGITSSSIFYITLIIIVITFFISIVAIFLIIYFNIKFENSSNREDEEDNDIFKYFPIIIGSFLLINFVLNGKN